MMYSLLTLPTEDRNKFSGQPIKIVCTLPVIIKSLHPIVPLFLVFTWLLLILLSSLLKVIICFSLLGDVYYVWPSSIDRILLQSYSTLGVSDSMFTLKFNVFWVFCCGIYYSQIMIFHSVLSYAFRKFCMSW